MEEAELANLATQWSVILRAAQEQGDAAASARCALLLRYHEAVLRYLRAELRDEHVAGQVSSNFAVRILEVDRFLQRADPKRGRFRDYLKTVLRHMVADYHREQQRENKQLEALARHAEEAPEPESLGAENDQHFLNCWRQELINWAWQRLEEAERRTGQPYAALLRLQEQQPGLRWRRRRNDWLFKWVVPSRRRECVRSPIADGNCSARCWCARRRSLQVDLSDPEGANRVEEELIDLGLLLSYCKSALDRCRQR